MTSKAAVKNFLSQRKLAVVGVSRGGKKFGNSAYRELKAKGYRVIPVHHKADMIEGDRCYPHISALPEAIDGVVIVVPPEETEKVVREAAESGIAHVWIQQGAESEKEVSYCKEHGINVVYGECILMFAEPTAFFHRLHRWARGLLGRNPQ